LTTKKFLRSILQLDLQNKTQSLYENQSNQISTILFSTEEWRSANTIAITISRPPEVDTYPIIQQAWKTGKTIVVPKCHKNSRTMTFHIIHSFDELETVFYGLLEPIVSQTVEVHKDSIDLVIVPGLGYTKKGYRLGFGGGYYDRFLSDYHGKKISLAFPEQIVPTVPVEAHDIPIHKLITPEEVINIG
jgi:5-formyltetrahydrofolate cyclo-ligase